jgi:gluconate 2-dehydrogenase gamma chain
MRYRNWARRSFLISSLSVMALCAHGAGGAAFDSRQWALSWSQMPPQVRPGPWSFFTPEEAAVIEALADRLIPADDLSPGGKDAGVAVYIDRQLAGGFGQDAGLYMQPPFADGVPGQGPQSPLTPAERYRRSLAALETYCNSGYLGKSFAELQGNEQDRLISMMESGTLQLRGVNSKAFFQLLWQNTKEGFFADPIYGGNRNMVGWKMIGFPGARYDYRDWIERHNEVFPLGPIGLADHPDWPQPSTQS